MTAAVLLVACAVLAGLAGVVVVLAVSLRRVDARLAALESRSSVEVVVPQPSRDPEPDGLEADATAPPSISEAPEFVITRLGTEPDEPAPTMEPKLFADVVLRESVVKAASWAYGVRRGLSPANRNRIWFEMRREVKRARKERKAEEREAIRQYRARRRAAVRETEAA